MFLIALKCNIFERREQGFKSSAHTFRGIEKSLLKTIVKIRAANSNDSATLTDLALRSKAYWGYSKQFIALCEAELTISENYIANHPVYLLEKEKKIIAFFSFSLKKDELAMFFVDPNYIGQGIGKLLWTNMIKKAQALNIKQLTIDSDPFAEGFYLKMGAKKIGKTPSTVFPNRYLPLLKVELT